MPGPFSFVRAGAGLGISAGSLLFVRAGITARALLFVRAGGTAGALCGLARHLLFTVDDADDETRTGLWSNTLATRLLPIGK